MSTSISIPLSPETIGFIEKMRNMPTLLRQAMRRGLDRGLAVATGEIVRSNFTGHGPFDPSQHKLGVRTNRLRSAIRWNVTGRPGSRGGQPSEIVGDTIRGQVGANIKYLGVHEYGFDGEVTVRAFSRHVSPTQFARPGTSISKKDRKSKKARQAALGMEQVRSFRRHMHMPARAPLSTGLETHRGLIDEQITLSLSKAWEAHER